MEDSLCIQWNNFIYLFIHRNVSTKYMYVYVK